MTIKVGPGLHQSHDNQISAHFITNAVNRAFFDAKCRKCGMDSGSSSIVWALFTAK